MYKEEEEVERFYNYTHNYYKSNLMRKLANNVKYVRISRITLFYIQLIYSFIHDFLFLFPHNSVLFCAQFLFFPFFPLLYYQGKVNGNLFRWIGMIRLQRRKSFVFFLNKFWRKRRYLFFVLFIATINHSVNQEETTFSTSWSW